MRQRLIIILIVLVVVTTLIVLNAATYVREEQKQDSEWSPNRSTYHAGPTGTRALYDFLSESGYKVMRWRELPEKLLGTSGRKVQTFVVVGPTALSFNNEQATSLLRWVEEGGRLVLIDRQPPAQLLPKSGKWIFVCEFTNFLGLNADPGNVQQMTENVKELQPVQPTVFTRDVETVMPSRLAARIRFLTQKESKEGNDREHQMGSIPEDEQSSGSEVGELSSESASVAPVAHLGDAEGALLVDYPHGLGRIVVLSEPYIVCNGGISLQDNLQLSTNVLSSAGGLIAFDEYHQGRGTTENALISYFSGTPVLAIAGQFALLMLLVLWSRGRRFARPLPLPHVDRRSKLEFVASMAELQQRSRAFDLAIENIYSRTRRALARYAGVDYNSPRSEIAARVALRSNLNSHQLETLMRQCEETINGAAVNWRQSLDLVRRLREVERALGLRMRSREVRQAAENI